MKLTVFCERTKEPSQANPVPLNLGLPNAPTAFSIRHQRSSWETKPAPGIEEVIPWGVFAAYAAVLASTGFLFVMALSGGIHLG
jgi:hypothetical protein